MSKEKIFYRFRYEQSAAQRRKIPFIGRTMELIREEHYAQSVRSYSTIMRGCTMAERLLIEGTFGDFPLRIIGYEDLLGIKIESFIYQLRDKS